MSSGKHAVPAVSAIAAAAAVPVALAGTVAPAVPAFHAATAVLDARVTRQVPPARPLVTRITSASAQKSYTVVSGDTLGGIAGRFCGKPGAWPALWHANQAEVPDPDLIYPGTVLRLTCQQLAAAAQADPPPVPAAVVPVAAVAGVSGGTLSFAGLESLWESAGGPASAAAAAATVAECESGGQQYAHNPSGASGYFQILGQVVPGDIYDPLVNARNAVAKFTASGGTFAQWVCRP